MNNIICLGKYIFRILALFINLIDLINSANQSLTPRTPRTPTRGIIGGTPQRTPTRNRTPNRSFNTTPNRISSQSRPTFKPPRVPDFVSLAREQRQQPSRGHNSFFAYNPEKEPIKVIRSNIFTHCSKMINNLFVYVGLFENSTSFG